MKKAKKVKQVKRLKGDGNQKPPTEANPTRQHHQFASEGIK